MKIQGFDWDEGNWQRAFGMDPLVLTRGLPIYWALMLASPLHGARRTWEQWLGAGPYAESC